MAESVASVDGFKTTGNRLLESDMRNLLQIGHLVSSIKGRDRGKYYLVVDILSQCMVLIANGEERKIENPKRKNVKHLHFFGIIAAEVSDKAMSGRRVTNTDIRKGIKSLAGI
ncbi:MAG: KOW domain-containing RNA-binding protein [Desulfotomaculaceae bacterium]|nr:KOW domain-containing RNA-binding protein [Desulfotomaculaceae bacterium]